MATTPSRPMSGDTGSGCSGWCSGGMPSFPPRRTSETFHERAIEEGRFHQERVAGSLSVLVFEQVFPDFCSGTGQGRSRSPVAPKCATQRWSCSTGFSSCFYAEDRDLLPVRDSRYDDYALRDRVRGDIGRRKDQGDVFSASAARYWSAFDDLCRAIDAGDASIGLPPYNGGLFDRDGALPCSRASGWATR